jgi:hypothetical protein
MQNIKIFKVVFSFIQNAEFIVLIRSKSKIKIVAFLPKDFYNVQFYYAK